MTIQEVAEFLRYKDLKAARRQVRDLGVCPFFLGKGRGRGFRYDKAELIEAVRKTQVRLHSRRKPGSHNLMDDLTAGRISVSQAADILMGDK